MTTNKGCDWDVKASLLTPHELISHNRQPLMFAAIHGQWRFLENTALGITQTLCKLRHVSGHWPRLPDLPWNGDAPYGLPTEASEASESACML